MIIVKLAVAVLPSTMAVKVQEYVFTLVGRVQPFKTILPVMLPASFEFVMHVCAGLTESVTVGALLQFGSRTRAHFEGEAGI